MSGTTEAFARVKTDTLLKYAGRNLTDASSILFEYTLPDGTLADYVLCDQRSRANPQVSPDILPPLYTQRRFAVLADQATSDWSIAVHGNEFGF